MIDYARRSKFDQLSDYELLRSQLRDTRERAGLLDSFAIEWDVSAKTTMPGLLNLRNFDAESFSMSFRL